MRGSFVDFAWHAAWIGFISEGMPNERDNVECEKLRGGGTEGDYSCNATFDLHFLLYRAF
jgi:hypothetical protein